VVTAPVYNEVPPILCYYFSYWQDVESEDFEMYVRNEQRRVIFSFKTEDDLFAVFVGVPMDEFPQVRSDIEGAFLRAVDAIPGFGERIRAGRRVERFYGASDLPNFYRKPYGPGWAVVGDAGGLNAGSTLLLTDRSSDARRIIRRSLTIAGDGADGRWIGVEKNGAVCVAIGFAGRFQCVVIERHGLARPLGRTSERMRMSVVTEIRRVEEDRPIEHRLDGANAPLTPAIP
jgi:hypothetical protein